MSPSLIIKDNGVTTRDTMRCDVLLKRGRKIFTRHEGSVVTHLLFVEHGEHGLKLWHNWIREVSEPSLVTAVQTTGVRIRDFCERRGVGGWVHCSRSSNAGYRVQRTELLTWESELRCWIRGIGVKILSVCYPAETRKRSRIMFCRLCCVHLRCTRSYAPLLFVCLLVLIPFCSTALTGDFERWKNRHCVLAMGYGMNDPGFESRQGNETFLFFKSLRRALLLIQPPIKWTATFLPGGKAAGA